MVRLLIEKGVRDVNQVNQYGETPLSLAATNGHVEMVKLLIEKGAYVNQTFKNGKTLSWAASNNHIDVMKLLIEKGAKLNQTNLYEMTRLHIAVASGHAEIAALLIQNGADVNQTDKDRRTPLHIALEYGHTEIVSLLIQNGAHVNWADRFKMLIPLLTWSSTDDVDPRDERRPPAP